MPEPREVDRPVPDEGSATPPQTAPRTDAQRGDLPGLDLRGLDLRGLDLARPLTVVLDAAHGTAVRTVAARLADDPAAGLRLVLVRADADPGGAASRSAAGGERVAGTRSHADAAVSTADLRAAVLEHEADLGVALDPTGSALTVLDETGEPVDEGVVAVLVALPLVAHELDAGRPATVVHDVLASRALLDLVGGAGGELVRTRVGLAALTEAVVAHDAVLGVGHGGVLLVGDAVPGRDRPRGDAVPPDGTGLLAGLHLVAALAGQPHPMSVLAELYQPYVSTGVLLVDVEDTAAATAAVHEAYVVREGAGPVDADVLDGLTVSHWDTTPQWWFSLRAPGAGAGLALLVEAADEDILDKVRDDVLTLVREDL